MIRRFTAQLADIFTEIGLDGLDPGPGKGLVEPDFLGGHRLGLDHLPHRVAAGNREQDGARVGCCLRPVDLATVLDQPPLEQFEIKIEVVGGFPAGRCDPGAGVFPAGKPAVTALDRVEIRADGFLQHGPVMQITGLDRCRGTKLFGRRGHWVASTSARWMDWTGTR